MLCSLFPFFTIDSGCLLCTKHAQRHLCPEVQMGESVVTSSKDHHSNQAKTGIISIGAKSTTDHMHGNEIILFL